MYCFQCEQAADGKGCTGAASVCGKKASTAELQDKLTGALVGLARGTEGNEDLVSSSTDKAVLEGLLAAANASLKDEEIAVLIAQVQEEKRKLVPNCFFCAAPCGRTGDYDMQELWNADEDIRSMKSLILFGISGMAAYAHQASVLGYTDKDVNDFFYKALFAIGMDWGIKELLPIVLEVGEVNLKCMALLDKVNNEASVLPDVDKAAKAVRESTVKRIFLLAPCDGAIDNGCCAEFVKRVPADSVVLYWYEQKAVCNLLTLLHLGVKDILLGSSLPAFVSPNVLSLLAENYNITPITAAEEDLMKFLG